MGRHRLVEALCLRVKDVVTERRAVTVRDVLSRGAAGVRNALNLR